MEIPFDGLTPDGGSDAIRKAKVVAVVGSGPDWDWNKKVPHMKSPGAPPDRIDPLKLRVKSPAERQRAIDLVLRIKEGRE